ARRVSLKLRRRPDSSWRRIKAEKIRDFNRDGALRHSSDDLVSLKNRSSDIVPPPLKVIPGSREQSFDCLLGPAGLGRDFPHRDVLPIAPQQKERVVFGKVSQHLLGPFLQKLPVKLFIEISTCEIDRLHLLALLHEVAESFAVVILNLVPGDSQQPGTQRRRA